MGALLLPILLGIAALVLEFGGGLLTRATNQRSADAAAVAGAVQYAASQSQDQMRASVLHTARLNGVAPANVSVSLVSSPRGSGQAVKVVIVEQKSIVLGTILGANPLLEVGVVSYATIGSSSDPGCILALDPAQQGITLQGGTKIAAPHCSVASNASISAPCGTEVTAKTVRYGTTQPSQGTCVGIKGPDGGPAQMTRETTPDPLAGNATVVNANARLTTVAKLLAVDAPTAAAGNNIDFGWNPATVAKQATDAGCTVGGSEPYYLLTCPGTALTLGSISVSSGITVDFDTGSSGQKTYTFGGSIFVNGGTIRFPGGTYSVARGIAVQVGKATFGAGTFKVGELATACRSGYSLCVSAGGTLEFGGPSSFTLSSGLYTGDGSVMKLGQGSANRFDIGPSKEGNSFSIGGGATTILADALGDDKSFRVRGHVNGGGGSCLIMGAAPQHDIAGRFAMSGAVILGAGVYTIDGVFHLGGGGGAPCGGSFVSVRALGVSLVLSGKDVPKGGACANQVFCISAGYGNVELTAPSTGPNAHLAVLGPLDGSVRGASFTAGSENTKVSGAFYFPTGPIVMGGGSGIGGAGNDTCLQLIASRIDLSAGASMASDCRNAGLGQKKKRVVVVQ